LCFLAISLIFALTLISAQAKAQSVDIEINQQVYRIELATTAEQRRQGLMHRPELGPDRGMLLVYQRSGNHRVWMKNMQIAIRVYWIDENFRVIATQRLEPCDRTPCPIFQTDSASRYILELSDREHAIKPGDRVDGLSGL